MLYLLDDLFHVRNFLWLLWVFGTLELPVAANNETAEHDRYEDNRGGEKTQGQVPLPTLVL